MGVYDLPAALDYTLQKTKQKRLYYAGHSMGTTMMFVLLSVRPEYNAKIRLFVCLSPVAYMSHMRSTIFRILYGPLGVRQKNSEYLWSSIKVSWLRFIPLVKKI
jgi:lysosomal acid lipase/cholesteryl ester hydrolase